MVTLGSSTPQGKELTLEMLKSSLLNEEARRKDNTSNFDYKALFKDLGDSNRGRDRQRNPQNRDKPNRC